MNVDQKPAMFPDDAGRDSEARPPDDPNDNEPEPFADHDGPGRTFTPNTQEREERASRPRIAKRILKRASTSGLVSGSVQELRRSGTVTRLAPTEDSCLGFVFVPAEL